MPDMCAAPGSCLLALLPLDFPLEEDKEAEAVEGVEPPQWTELVEGIDLAKEEARVVMVTAPGLL